MQQKIDHQNDMVEYSKKIKKKMRSRVNMVKGASVGAELSHLDADKTIPTDPHDYNKRRTLKLMKRDNSWGFKLQTYGVKHKKTNEIEVMTYVDYVDIGGPAWIAGMRRGDVILSVNGENVCEMNHQELVSTIRRASDTLRLVVIFEDCCKKVELHEKFLKLKAVLRSKYEELRNIENKEIQILQKYHQSNGINRLQQIRHSILSNVSLNSDSWDRYSEISSPVVLKSTGHYRFNRWSVTTPSCSMGNEMHYHDDDSIVSDLDSEDICTDFDDMISKHNSDSNLTLGYGVVDDDKPWSCDNNISNEGKLKLEKKNRLRSSDSALYKSSFIAPVTSYGSVQLFKQRQFARQGEHKAFESDDVFENEKKMGASFSILMQDKSKVFYKGENGNIIVPKICIEGKEMYTTFDHIDLNEMIATDLPVVDPITYRDKVVAIDIAQEMVKLDKIGRDSSSSLDRTQVSNTLIKTQRHSSSDSEILVSARILHKLHNNKLFKQTIGEANMMLTTRIDDNHVNATTPNNVSINDLNVSCEQLKSSVPDLQISFYAEQCQLIYVNDKDETTKL